MMNKLISWILISDLSCIIDKLVISERFLSYLIARVGKGPPKLRMIASGSPKLRRFLPTTKQVLQTRSLLLNMVGSRRVEVLRK